MGSTSGGRVRSAACGADVQRIRTFSTARLSMCSTCSVQVGQANCYEPALGSSVGYDLFVVQEACPPLAKPDRGLARRTLYPASPPT